MGFKIGGLIQQIRTKFEDGVKSDRQLNDSETRSDMSTRARTDFDETRAHLLRECAQLVARHRLEIRGRIYAIEN